MRSLLLLALALFAGSVQGQTVTVPVGYQATARWSPVTQLVDDTPVPGSVSYKMYNIKNGVSGYMGSTTALTWKWAVNVTQCVYVTAVVYIGGVAKESGHSGQVCFTVP